MKMCFYICRKRFLHMREILHLWEDIITFGGWLLKILGLLLLWVHHTSLEYYESNVLYIPHL